MLLRANYAFGMVFASLDMRFVERNSSPFVWHENSKTSFLFPKESNMPYEKIANTTSGLVELLGFLGHDSLDKEAGNSYYPAIQFGNALVLVIGCEYIK